MRALPVALVLIIATTVSGSAETLTPQRCRQIADAAFPLIAQLEALRKQALGLDYVNITRSAKGRLKQAAEEVSKSRDEFASATGDYGMSVAFLYNEARNCESGITLERTPE